MGVAESISAVAVAGTVTGLSYTQATAQQSAARGEGGGGGGGARSGAGADGPSKGAFPASSSSGFDGGGGGGGGNDGGGDGGGDATPETGTTASTRAGAKGGTTRQSATQTQNGVLRGSRRSQEAESTQKQAASRLSDSERTRKTPEPPKPRHKSNPNRRKRRGGPNTTSSTHDAPAPPSSPTVDQHQPSPPHPPSNAISTQSEVPAEAKRIPQPRHKSNPNHRKRRPKRPEGDVSNATPSFSGGLPSTRTTRRDPSQVGRVSPSQPGLRSSSPSAHEKADSADGVKRMPQTRPVRARPPLMPNVSRSGLPVSEARG